MGSSAGFPNGSTKSATSSIVGGGAAKKANGSSDLASWAAGGVFDAGVGCDSDADAPSPGDGGVAPNGFADWAVSPEGAAGAFGGPPNGLDAAVGGGDPKGLEDSAPGPPLAFGATPKGFDAGDPN